MDISPQDTPCVFETLLMRDSDVLHYRVGITVLGEALCVPVSTRGLQTAMEDSVGSELAIEP